MTVQQRILGFGAFLLQYVVAVVRRPAVVCSQLGECSIEAAWSTAAWSLFSRVQPIETPKAIVQQLGVHILLGTCFAPFC